MRVRLLGTAAGGGFPQWNCACRGCVTARRQPDRARPRTQFSVALSADGRRWFLVNASPDVRTQIESFPELVPATGRGTAIEGVLLTTADLDHTLGLFVLREGRALRIFASAPIRDTLNEGLRTASVLGAFCGVEWREPPAEPTSLPDWEGRPSGLTFAAFPIRGKPPRYAATTRPAPGQTVGYRIADPSTGGVIVIASDVGGWDETLRVQAGTCDLLLLDGTFWADDDMITAGVGTTRAAQMAHWPLSGAHGSLAEVRAARAKRTVLVHVNNTNPILIEGSPERGIIEDSGLEVGVDGWEVSL